MACLRLYAAVMVVYSLSVTPSSAESSAQLTVLAASPGNPPSGVYEYVQIVWDQKAELQYLQVRWSAPGIKFAARPGDLWRCEGSLRAGLLVLRRALCRGANAQCAS